jgi:hypothetical protein
MFRHSLRSMENCICDLFQNGEVCSSTQGTQPLVSKLSCHATIGREIDSSRPTGDISLLPGKFGSLFIGKIEWWQNADAQTGTQYIQMYQNHVYVNVFRIHFLLLKKWKWAYAMTMLSVCLCPPPPNQLLNGWNLVCISRLLSTSQQRTS